MSPETGLEIRALKTGDIPEVRALWSRCEGLGEGPGDSEVSLARFLARNPGFSAVAVKGGEFVGAALCGHDGRRGFLYRVAVLPTHRRQGIAHALVTRCLTGLKAEGLERSLFFVLGSNDGAKRFWGTMGAKWRKQLEIHSIDL